MTNPYLTRSEYQNEIVGDVAPWPEYTDAVQESIRRIKEEDALVRENYDGLGTRLMLTDTDKPDDITTSLMDNATMGIVSKVVNEEDETITEEEVVNRLEELLNSD
ncbi:hypothetical protein N0B31_10170 [Salinirubellus salinus]|uniref:Uncharacterized protein n=1 Tax=Salinirubellus salinus TaxID=1364945 RepID=A0A9E7U6M9_9EURY|nr:hypothetical protein [Salinirubellus salinus]UWM56640.1 hypothetical protein N0B31_10170 [Salinirubellus salinus]